MRKILTLCVISLLILSSFSFIKFINAEDTPIESGWENSSGTWTNTYLSQEFTGFDPTDNGTWECWSDRPFPDVVSTPVYSGSYALKTTMSSQYFGWSGVYKEITFGNDTVCVSLFANVLDLPGSGTISLINMGTFLSQDVASLYITCSESSQSLQLTNGKNSQGNIGSNTAVVSISENSWNHYEVDATIGGNVTVYYNNILVINQQFNWTGITEMSKPFIGQMYSSIVGTVYLDDVVISPTHIGMPEKTEPYSVNTLFSSTFPGEDSTISIKWQDSTGLSTGIFSSNITGEWVNQEPVNLTGQEWFNVTLTLPSLNYDVIVWQQNVTNLDSVVGTTNQQVLLVTNGLPPPGEYSTILGGGWFKTTVTVNTENHFWGTLLTANGYPLKDQPIYLAYNGTIQYDLTPYSQTQYTYPQNSVTGGGIDLCWYMNDPGVWEVTPVYLGNATEGVTLHPVNATSQIITVLPPYTPLTAQTYGLGESEDPRMPSGKIGMSFRNSFAQNEENEYWQVYKNTGTAWNRIELNWFNLEHTDDKTFHFTNDIGGNNWDLIIQNHWNAEIGMIGLLDYGKGYYTTPDYQTYKDTYNPDTGLYGNGESWFLFNAGHPPDMTNATQSQAWLDFINATVTRYHDKIAVWEIWNEQNIDGFWYSESTEKSVRAWEYALLFNATSELIHNIDPTATVMVGGFFGCDTEYLYYLYQYGCGEHIDAIGVHPYNGGYLPNSIETATWGSTEGDNVLSWSFNPCNVMALNRFSDVPAICGYDPNTPIYITEWADFNGIQSLYFEGTVDDLWSQGLQMFWDLMNDQNIDFTYAQFISANKTNLGNIRAFVPFTFYGGDIGATGDYGSFYAPNGTLIHPKGLETFTKLCKAYNIENSFTMNLTTGWNQVSFNIIPSPNTFSELIDDIHIALYWNGSSYKTATTITSGISYWIFVFSNQTVTLEGTPTFSIEKTLTPGWNTIETVMFKTLDATVVLEDEYHSLVTWNGNKYITATTIEPNKGYWIFVLTEKQISIQ